MATILLIYALAGTIGGILAGLLGIGGGLIIVPLLVMGYTWQQLPDAVMMHMALGTSMASIVFTSISSFRAHHRRGAVHWAVVRRMAVGVLCGTFAGTCITAAMPTGLLKGVFVFFLYYVSIQLIIDKKPKPSRQLPGKAGLFGIGNFIGALSSLVGIGGGALSVPFMIWCNMSLHHAIGTSAAIGFPIAVAGTVGYVLNGWDNPALPPYSLGFVYLPALIGLVVTSVLFAPLGAELAHRLPVSKLKRVFALLLLVVATKMLVGML